MTARRGNGDGHAYRTQSAVSPEGRVKLGSLLADVGRLARLTDEEFTVFAQVRDKTPACPASFD